MKLITLAEWRRRYFDESSRPSERTVRRQIRVKELPGKRIGKLWYIDLHKWLADGDPLVERTLAG